MPSRPARRAGAPLPAGQPQGLRQLLPALLPPRRARGLPAELPGQGAGRCGGLGPSQAAPPRMLRASPPRPQAGHSPRGSPAAARSAAPSVPWGRPGPGRAGGGQRLPARWASGAPQAGRRCHGNSGASAFPTAHAPCSHGAALRRCPPLPQCPAPLPLPTVLWASIFLIIIIFVCGVALGFPCV